MVVSVFYYIGDMLHIASKLILLMQLHKSRNARGISVKTQELYLIVFVMRYLDLFTRYISLYNSSMKVFYISVTVLTICKIKYLEPIKSVYNAEQDSFPHWKCAVPPCLILAFAHIALKYSDYGDNIDYGVLVFMTRPMSILMEWMWETSIFLESIAILPQLFVLRRYRLVENLTGRFMLCLGSYRVFYILNWIYRSQTEDWYRPKYMLSIAAVIQACMYLDFFIQYMKISSLSPCCGKRNEHDADDDEGGLIFEISRTQEQHALGEVSSDPLLIIHDAEDMTTSSSSKGLVERRSRSTYAEAKV